VIWTAPVNTTLDSAGWTENRTTSEIGRNWVALSGERSAVFVDVVEFLISSVSLSVCGLLSLYFIVFIKFYRFIEHL